MAKQQQLIELFPKYDTDHDGQINHQQFSELVTELGLPYIYPGSIKKMIRKLNWENPDKETINMAQTIQYYNSFQTPSKHDIWKAKYNLLQNAHEVRCQLNKENGNNPTAAAPGAGPSKQVQDNTVQEANIRVLVGPNKPAYSSQIDFYLQKSDKGPKVKPFIKLVCKYKQSDKAIQMETVFKQNFHAFLKLLGQDIGDWLQEMDNFKINSMVHGSTVTFFITTINEEMVSLIQLFSEMLELSFGNQPDATAHFHYEFQYDFEQFIKKESSNFYDLFVKEARLSFNAKAQRLLREIRKYFQVTEATDLCYGGDVVEALIPISLLHLDGIEADIEFDSFQNQVDYELDSKQEINQALEEAASFILKLEEGGMSRRLIELLDCELNVQVSVGDWRAKLFLRLTNLNKVFLEALTKLNNKSQNCQAPSASDNCNLVQIAEGQPVPIVLYPYQGTFSNSAKSQSSGSAKPKKQPIKVEAPQSKQKKSGNYSGKDSRSQSSGSAKPKKQPIKKESISVKKDAPDQSKPKKNENYSGKNSNASRSHSNRSIKLFVKPKKEEGEEEKEEVKSIRSSSSNEHKGPSSQAHIKERKLSDV